MGNSKNSSRAVQSKWLRSRGQGETAEDRARSRAAFKGWDTRRSKEVANSNTKRQRRS